MRTPALLALFLSACGGARPAPEPVGPSADSSASSASPASVPADADPRRDPSFRVAASKGGSFTLAWRPVAGALPRNERCELELFLYRGEEPLSGAQLSVSGWMPDHGHGMLVQPQAFETGAGRYLVTGVLLHMRGSWVLFFDVISGAYSERAEFALEVK